MWHQAWIKSIEQCKAGLAAPLLVQHPESGKILVNFDKEIMQLVREAKYMQRFNITVPESAQMVLLQEEKFKFYHNQLTHLVGRAILGCEGAMFLGRLHLNELTSPRTLSESVLARTKAAIPDQL